MNVSRPALQGTNRPPNRGPGTFEANFTMGLREFFDTQKGRNLAMAILAVGVLAAIVSIWFSMGSSETQISVNEPVYINDKTGEVRNIKLKIGVPIPEGFHRA